MANFYQKIRSLLRCIVLDFMGSFKRPSSYVHILNGHMVDWHHDNDADGERFARQLLELHKYCDFVNVEDAVRIRTGEHGEEAGKETDNCIYI